jgi:hypothetical protein
MLFVSFRRARRFTAPRRMPEFRTVFHSPRAIREAAVTHVAIQLRQLEEVLIQPLPEERDDVVDTPESPSEPPGDART